MLAEVNKVSMQVSKLRKEMQIKMKAVESKNEFLITSKIDDLSKGSLKKLEQASSVNAS